MDRTRLESAEGYRLSPRQRRLWSLQRRDPAFPRRAACVVSISGPLDLGRLTAAVDTVARRHEILRTQFCLPRGASEPMQVIEDRGVSLRQTVVQAEPGEVLRRALRVPVGEKGPAVEVSVCTIAPEEHQMVVEVPALAADRASLGLLVREIEDAYASGPGGARAPADAIQYADIAEWQHQVFEADEGKPGREFWRRQDPGRFVVGRLSGRGTAPRGEFEPRTRSLRLPIAELQRLADRFDVPLHTLLLGCWQVFVSRATGRADTVVGVTFSGRNYPELADAVGLFAVQVPSLARLDGSLSFREAVLRVHRAATDAEKWQECFSWESLEARGGETHDVLPFGFEWREAFSAAAPSAETKMTVAAAAACTDRAEVRLVGTGADGTPIVEIEYDAAAISREDCVRLGARFETLVASVLRDPQAPIGALELLPARERTTWVRDFNATSTGEPADGETLTRSFERRVVSAPSRVALEFEGRELSYRELDDEAERLAHVLHRRGVSIEDRVAVLLDASPEMLVALLAVVKAGGAFVPVDPRCPSRRVSRILRDSGARTLLTRSSLRAVLPAARMGVICVDDLVDASESEESARPGVSVDPDNAACVLYASDASGVPRGTVVLHRGLVNYLAWCARSYGVAGGRGTVAHAAVDREETLTCLLAPLLLGERCRILADGGRDPLEQALRDGTRASMSKTNPAGLEQLGRALESGEVSGSIRTLVVSGDALPSSAIASWRARAAGTLLVNEYGTAETSGGCCSYEVTETESHGETVPIGRPIANARAYLLDSWLHPVAPGLEGELYVGGTCVARGYLERPDATATSFVPDPFGDEPGGRLFRTGDICRLQTDGQLEFVRRADRQVKVSGRRVDPGEVEALLVEHPAVRECVVACRETEPRSRRLVAYVVPDASTPSPAELESFLQERLPADLIPSAHVLLDSVPRTPGGAVDYDALPAPTGIRPPLSAPFVPPRDDLEATLAGVWADVLGLDRVGVHDRFGDLGGHLVEALRLASRISKGLGRAVPLDLLFAHPTVASLADAVRELPAGGRGAKAAESRAGRPVAGSVMQSVSPYLKIEPRPLLPLVATGKLAPVDAASLGYLPLSFLRHTGFDRDEFIQRFCDDLPVFSSILETGLGRVATILLPRFDGELYRNEEDLVQVAVDALEMAGQIGARTVSLSGLIASASNCGRSIASRIHGRDDLPRVTTGHATTAAANFLSIRGMLEEAGRTIDRERVGFLGLGTVGRATLRLMLHGLPHPAEILLCDAWDRWALLEEIQREIVEDLRFRGRVRLVGSGAEAPAELRNASLILSTTNVPGILPVDRLAPGTLVVDDSAPSCFRADEAVRRFRDDGDILLTEGGVIGPPEPIQRLFFLPKSAEQFITPEQVDAVANHDPRRIQGCTFSSVLTERFDDLGPTVGPVDVDTCQRHVAALADLGFGPARVRFDRFTPDAEAIRRFRARFGPGARDDA